MQISCIISFPFRPIGFEFESRDLDSFLDSAPFDISTPPTREEKGGRGRESQFPERSHCNLRLKQRGGTTITDCMRDRRRGERERDREG